MSYILDALRRADAEREREKSAVPGLNAQPLPPLPADDPRRVGLPLRGAAAVAGGLVLLGSAMWFMRGGVMPMPGAARPPAVAPLKIGTNGTGTRSDHVAPVADDSAASAATAGTSFDASPPRPVAVSTALSTGAPGTAPPGRLPEPAPARVATQMPAPAPLPLAIASPAPPPGVAANGDTSHTPPGMQAASLPPVPADVHLVPGGSIWSDIPASRMLILNGQVLHEGDHATADVVLERIGPKVAVVVVRGARYQLPY